MYKFIPQLVCSCHCHTLICSIAWERQCSVYIHIDLPYLCIIRASAYALILLITFPVGHTAAGDRKPDTKHITILQDNKQTV